MSDPKASFVVPMVAPTSLNFSSEKFAAAPAPDSTTTLKPYLTSFPAASGAMATLFSLGKVSLGIPTTRFLVSPTRNLPVCNSLKLNSGLDYKKDLCIL